MTSEETVLMKAFKYFDLNNNGTVEPDEFAKAIEKIGIMIPTRQVSLDSFGLVFFPLDLLIIIRIWMRYLASTMQINLAHLTIKNLRVEFSAVKSLADPLLRDEAVVVQTPKTLLPSSSKNSHQEVPEASLVSESSSASWMTITPDR